MMYDYVILCRLVHMCRLGVKIIPKLDDSAIERQESQSQSRQEEDKERGGPNGWGLSSLRWGLQYDYIII